MSTITLQSPAANDASSASVAKSSVPFYLYATVLSSLSIIIGLIWDISWHMSIGRDGLFSAPHLAIYLGGVTAGIFSGYRVLKITCAGSPFERGKAIKFWGIFYGSLGNLFCIWGAIAMLTSAPFDDWWHNTYGLDVTILSPPHTVLLLGMITIQFGAIISVLAYQNLNTEHVQQDHITHKGFTILFALSGGFVLTMIFTIGSEYLSRHDMHGVLFYQVASILFPLFLVAFSVAAKSKWGATQSTMVYTILLMVMNWILPLFPATPRLGPVLNPITSFQPFEFPLLILIPAIVIDLITHRMQHLNRWLRVLLYGVSFLVIFAAVQWPFANVLMASEGHWFFGTSKWYFGTDPTWVYRYAFGDWMVSTGLDLVKGLAIALLIAILSSHIGLSWGNWMKKIMR
jgi:hypothetical protein